LSNLFLELSFYQPDWHSHGGVHRTLQVAELLRATGLPVPPPAPPPPPGSGQMKSNPLRRLVGIVAPPLRRAVVRRREIAGFQQRLAAVPDAKLMIWESTRQLFPAEEARRRALKVIAVPQQLEALDPNEPERTPTAQLLDALKRELAALVSADAVFGLSQEDAWFLRLCGAKAFCLPYYPCAGLEAELLAIRANRPAETTPRFLLIGTAIHPATKRALKEVLGWLTEARKHVSFQLDVAGFGSETLADAATHPDFTLHGSVSQERLTELQLAARGAIVHHVHYSGMLTRVSELLMAGVPVLANEAAARCAPPSSVHVYRNADDLAALLGTALPTPPKPIRPEAEERVFIETVKRLAS
jgi:hypothetical protein